MSAEHHAMIRVTKAEPCPICGKRDWCGLSADGAVCICMRAEQGAVKVTRNGGFLHVLHRDPARQIRSRVRRVLPIDPDKPRPDLARLAAKYRATASVDRSRTQAFADELGVSYRSLVRLGVGWSWSHRAWTFPMRSANELVRGIRLRTGSGRKFSVRGGQEGLFIPFGVACDGQLLVAEGPTDVAALLDLGFEAIGRPNCSGGTRLLVEFVRKVSPSEVILVADSDGPGRGGAEALARELLLVAPSVRVIRPPEPIKDARAWKQAGATRKGLQDVIKNAPVRTLRIRRRTGT